MKETASRPDTENRKSPLEKLGQPDQSRIEHVIAVMSGKGVGKSSISALLAAS